MAIQIMNKPMMKRIVFVREMEPGRLRVGELFPDRAVEIEDEDGLMLQLIHLLDGTRTISGILSLLNRGGKTITESELLELISELDTLGLLENSESSAFSSFSATERERYKANVNYFSYFSSLDYSSWEMQQKLNQATVTVIGIGTLGSGVLFNLAGLGVGKVRLVDFDVVEWSNLNRQLLYNEGDIGRSKMDAAREFIRRFHSGIALECIHGEIGSAEDAEKAIAGSNLVILSADQPHLLLERWVNRACVKQGIPFLGGGIHVVEGQLYTVVPAVTGCLDCNYLRQSRQDDDYVHFIRSYVSSGFKMPSTAIAANYMLLTGMMCGELARKLTGTGPLQSEGKVLSIHFETFRTAIKMDLSSPESECPTCGQGKGTEPVFRFLRDLEKKNGIGFEKGGDIL